MSDDRARRTRPGPARAARTRAIGQLLDAVAHEVNQPLMSISANAGAALRRLRRDPAAVAPVEALLREILAQSQRAGQVIQTLQTLAQRRARFGTIGLHALAYETPERARAALERARTRLELDLAAPRDAVEGDPGHLRQLLLELIQHALLAMGPAPEEDGDALRVLRLASAASGAGIELRVEFRDQGGADPAGMALAICRAIAEGHGGSLKIRARRPQVCSIIVTLPELQGEPE
jgi:signal transduction histidine kinase